MKQLILFTILITNLAFAQNKSILISNATLHIGNDSLINNSLVGIHDGKIVLVADATTSKIDANAYELKIDASGKHIYPGFIAPNSTLGLVEIEAVRATLDFDEVGNILPNVRTLIAYNTDSKIIPTIRSNGILLAQITSRGGLVSGTSSIVMLDGWNWEDAVFKADEGIHINWPRMITKKYDEETQLVSTEKNKNYDKQTNDLIKLFTDAKAYAASKDNSEKNLRFEALGGLFDSTKTLFIHSNTVKEITESVMAAKKAGILKMVIVGGKDSWLITGFLKENNIPVIVSRVHDLPDRLEDDIDLPYKLPYLLQKAGILFCLNNEGDMEAMGTRNLPFMAGTAAAYGLTKEQALKSITFNTAKILGIDKSTGSIEVGKDATLFISSGDALDMKSSNVEHAFIKGKEIDLNNSQKQLYEKYKTKYELK